MAHVEGGAGGVGLRMDEDEAHVLRSLATEMKELIEAEAVVDDAVIDRLFPSAYADPEDARAFSELVGDELRTGKLDSIRSVLSLLGENGEVDTMIPRSEIDGWLTVLTDLRLALGTRLNVTEEKMEADLDPSDPRASGMAVLHWLGWLQEMLIRAIAEESDDG